MLSSLSITSSTAVFQNKLLAWWDINQADLPWRHNKEPYAIWVSEIMLQQTQIVTVIPYFERWIIRFPTVQALAEASLDEVLKLWQGLGYYGRARNLHAAAQMVMLEWNGRIPQTVAELMILKGIGRYTAGAIASIAFDEPAPILDGNVIRILSRLTDLANDVTQTRTKNGLWQLADELVPAHRPGDFNQAMMELGQQLCLPTKPQCSLCPLSSLCLARQRGTQLERPVRPPRKRIPHYDVVAGIIWQQGAAVGDPNGKFLIAQRPLDGLLGGLWEFPGGKQEPNETLPQALIREIEEELAMEISVENFVISVKHAYTHFRITLHAFHARHLSGNPQHLGVINHAWVTLDDLDDYAFAVTDRKIIAAFFAKVGRVKSEK
ncbi:MAG: A/G-specific adenine glycosylase [Chloroflexi bacterium]|nr:A/G-specific adenine glycosylase [Chloroflexota bacterium]